MAIVQLWRALSAAPRASTRHHAGGVPWRAIVATRSALPPERRGEEEERPTAATTNSRVGLVPYFDLINHAADVQSVVQWNPRTGDYEVSRPRARLHALSIADTTARQVLTSAPRLDGREVFISYGDHDNGILLQRYGFALRDNPHDALDVTLRDVESCLADTQGGGWPRPTAAQWAGMQACGLYAAAASVKGGCEDRFSFRVFRDQMPPWELRVYLLVRLLPGGELGRLVESAGAMRGRGRLLLGGSCIAVRAGRVPRDGAHRRPAGAIDPASPGAGWRRRRGLERRPARTGRVDVGAGHAGPAREPGQLRRRMRRVHRVLPWHCQPDVRVVCQPHRGAAWPWSAVIG